MRLDIPSINIIDEVDILKKAIRNKINSIKPNIEQQASEAALEIIKDSLLEVRYENNDFLIYITNLEDLIPDKIYCIKLTNINSLLIDSLEYNNYDNQYMLNLIQELEIVIKDIKSELKQKHYNVYDDGRGTSGKDGYNTMLGD